MDLLRIIRELHEEKKRLDRVIASLEQLEADGLEYPPLPPAKSRSRRGRKGMSEEERREVSDRMTRYWASRREAKTKAAEKNEAFSQAAKSGS